MFPTMKPKRQSQYEKVVTIITSSLAVLGILLAHPLLHLSICVLYLSSLGFCLFCLLSDASYTLTASVCQLEQEVPFISD